MPNFTFDEIRNAMDKLDNIRNMSVIAHVDHGKTTLTDSFVCKAGIISVKAAGEAHYTDSRPDEQARGVTIKSTGVSLYYNLDTEDGKGDQGYLVNLIDSPGHVDFSSEVTAALRVTDGALVVIDCLEGCAVQTETVLRQSLQERVRPVLFLNKMDRCMVEMTMEPEDIYNNFRKAIEDVNVIISTYRDDHLGDVQVYPDHGTICFGSGLQGWAFSLDRFAKIYAKPWNVSVEKAMRYLWGDWFFWPEQKKWATTPMPEGHTGRPLKRGFCQFVIEPIMGLWAAIIKEEKEKYEKMFEKLGIHLKGDDKLLTGKPLFKKAMQTWLPAADNLLLMIVKHLPSPKKAQKYRVLNLYDGPMDDEGAKAIRECDPKGPVMMYVSKMIPTPEKGRFYAYGRVFSGTIATGMKIRIQGPEFEQGSNHDLFLKPIQRTYIMMGRTVEAVNDIPCGNTCGVMGVDQYVVKTCTLTDLETACNFTTMKYFVSPVVRVAVKPKDPKDLPKLVEGLKKLAKSDPLVVCSTDEETGEHVIAGSGELHVEICMADLRNDYAQVDLIQGDPVVSYRETITVRSTDTALAKSRNGHNRLFLQAEPLPEALCKDIEDGKCGPKTDAKERDKWFKEKYGWDATSIKKIWTFGPDMSGSNLVVDQTVSIAYLNEIKDHFCSGFQVATKSGVLCGEQMRGCRFNLMDVTLHPDAIHRGLGEILPATRRVLYAAAMLSEPTLLEPYYLAEIVTPQAMVASVYEVLNMRRGMVAEELQKEGSPLLVLKAHLPVAESFGFTGHLREKTSGKASPSCSFDHWELINGLPLVDKKAEDLVLAIRKRKNLKAEMPILSEYLDKL